MAENLLENLHCSTDATNMVIRKDDERVILDYVKNGERKFARVEMAIERGWIPCRDSMYSCRVLLPLA